MHIRTESMILFWYGKIPLREKYPNREFFLVRIFLYSDWIQEKMDQKKLRIWTLFTQCTGQRICTLACFICWFISNTCCLYQEKEVIPRNIKIAAFPSLITCLITRLIVIDIALLMVLLCNCPLFCICPLADL